jgi:hypothetical protein
LLRFAVQRNQKYSNVIRTTVATVRIEIC